MADEKTVALDCDQYEDLKEAVVKAVKAECAVGGNADNGQFMRKLDEVIKAAQGSTEQVANLSNKYGQTDFKPIIRVQPPDMTDVNDAFQAINDNSADITDQIKKLSADVRTALTGEKIDATAQKFVGREVEKHIETLDGHWKSIYRLLENLEKRIPYNYDINKRLVWACI